MAVRRSPADLRCDTSIRVQNISDKKEELLLVFFIRRLIANPLAGAAFDHSAGSAACHGDRKGKGRKSGNSSSFFAMVANFTRQIMKNN